MASKYTLTVKNQSKNYGNICVFQTMPGQPDNISSLAWFSKTAHPETSVEFDWVRDYNFVCSDQGELKPGVTLQASWMQEDNCCETTDGGMNHSMAEDNGTVPDGDAACKVQPKYWMAFGEFQEGEAMDAGAVENAIELKPDDAGKTVIVNEDNSISIE